MRTKDEDERQCIIRQHRSLPGPRGFDKGERAVESCGFGEHAHLIDCVRDGNDQARWRRRTIKGPVGRSPSFVALSWVRRACGLASASPRLAVGVAVWLVSGLSYSFTPAVRLEWIRHQHHTPRRRARRALRHLRWQNTSLFNALPPRSMSPLWFHSRRTSSALHNNPIRIFLIR